MKQWGRKKKGKIEELKAKLAIFWTTNVASATSCFYFI